MTVDREVSPKRRKLNTTEAVLAADEEESDQESEFSFHEETANNLHVEQQQKDVAVKSAANLSAVTEEDDSDELIEKLLRQAEESLSSQISNDQQLTPRVTLNPGKLPRPYFEITKKGNKLLTEQLEDSLVVSATDTTIKRLSPPISKAQKEKVIPIPISLVDDDTLSIYRSNSPDCRFDILLP